MDNEESNDWPLTAVERLVEGGDGMANVSRDSYLPTAFNSVGNGIFNKEDEEGMESEETEGVIDVDEEDDDNDAIAASTPGVPNNGICCGRIIMDDEDDKEEEEDKDEDDDNKKEDEEDDIAIVDDDVPDVADADDGLALLA